ncbi:MAG TPA: GGDEF domain-containing protein, partial [Noviherbaspirillum sp.]|nr:GGDEF domain-containing protein [Noviherbaspirillum sp.]
QSLADLAALVERELELRVMNESQLALEKKNKNLRRKSLIDPLIGTWNRGAIMRILTIEAIRCDKAGVPLSLIVADLDYFKKINDTYGHPAGDAVLVKVASRLRSCIRPQEALGRYGGEEFLIVLPGSSHKTAMAVAERMRATIAAQPESINGVALNLTISAGIASTDLFPSVSTEELISKADIALYAAKDAGRNRVITATPDLS